MVCTARWGAAVFYVLALGALYTDAESNRKKDREVSGLYPFPRVGRRDTLLDSAFSEYIKRQGLIPFPRVGRGGSMSGDKGDQPNEQRLWFGPRLGRAARSDKPEWTLVQIEDPSHKGATMLGKDATDGRPVEDLAAPDDQTATGRLIAW